MLNKVCQICCFTLLSLKPGVGDRSRCCCKNALLVEKITQFDLGRPTYCQYWHKPVLPCYNCWQTWRCVSQCPSGYVNLCYSSSSLLRLKYLRSFTCEVLLSHMSSNVRPVFFFFLFTSSETKARNCWGILIHVFLLKKCGVLSNLRTLDANPVFENSSFKRCSGSNFISLW